MIATEYCKKVFDGTHDSPKPVENGRLLITSKHIANRSLDISSAYLISEEDFENVNKRSQVHQWDILFSMIGTVGNVYIETSEKIDYAIKNMGVFSCQNKEKAYWLYYYLQSPLVQAKIDALMTGAVQKFVPLGFLRDLDIPEYTENSKKVVQVLSALDDKIALNKKMNQKLERMAKRLYDYWFVQYDFPDKNGHPYKTTGGPMTYNPTLKREIPVGWEVLPIGDILDKYKTTKKFNTSDYKTNGKYPIVDQDTSTFIAGYTDDEDVLKRFPAVLFGDHSTCVKFLNFEFGRGADGTQILYSKNERIHQFYLYMAIKSMSIPNPGYARHFKFLKEMPIILPCQKLADEYQKRMEPIYAAITKVDLESRAIIRLRDKLLPLLMNGQVVVG
jgi:type I restriction enzyme S subunit